MMKNIKILKRKTRYLIILIICLYFICCKKEQNNKLLFYAAYRHDTSSIPFRYFILSVQEIRTIQNIEQHQTWMKYNSEQDFNIEFSKERFIIEKNIIYQKIRLLSKRDTLVNYLFLNNTSVIKPNSSFPEIDKSEINFNFFEKYEIRKLIGDSSNGIKKYEIRNPTVEGYNYILYIDSSFIPIKKIYNQSSNMSRVIQISRKACPISDSIIAKFQSSLR